VFVQRRGLHSSALALTGCIILMQWSVAVI